MVKYNQATIADYKAILSLVNEFELDNQVAYQSIDNIDQEKVKSDNKKYVKKYLQDKTCKYIVCRQKTEIVGYIFLSVDETYKGEGYINELYIVPTQRKNGFATQLVHLGLQWLKKNKCNKIDITVNRKNKNALKLYKKFGFDIFKDSYVSMRLKM
jgi:ribosomal protein S18 acetylase RimI-like enzyme